jgi:hypothetical protein
MDYLLHNTPDVTIAFGKIKGAESGGCLVEMCVRFELDVTWKQSENKKDVSKLGLMTYDCVRASLSPNYPTHREF